MIPAFSSPIDCTPWVIGGVWPVELSPITAETATAAECLKVDLERIVDSANEELKAIRQARISPSVRQSEEARVINAARAFALRRAESAVRHLRAPALNSPAHHRRTEAIEAGAATGEPAGKLPDDVATGRYATEAVNPDDGPPEEPIDSASLVSAAVDFDDVDANISGPMYLPDTSDTEAAESFDAAVTESPDPMAETTGADSSEVRVKKQANAATKSESESERLCRLVQFMGRQEPGLRWAAGNREDGTTVLVTDLAHGWIPSGITLPAGVRLLEPDRRSGHAATLLGPITLSATYAPGDPLGWATDSRITETSLQPRDLPAVADLGWLLSEATHWRDGLPRMVNTLVRAGAAGTGVLEAEIDVLRVHLDTARYQVLAQYPDVDAALLLNTFLLAAAESIATGDLLSANYHFSWFQKLSAPPASTWTSNL